MKLQTFTLAAFPALLAACSTATPPPQSSATTAATAATAPSPATAEKPRLVRSRDGSFEGEVLGTPAAGSVMAKVEIGMTDADVAKVMGRAPSRSHSYYTAKRWIPLYFGNDATRMQVLFEGEGCLIYATANRFISTTPNLIRIEYDRSGKCYQP